MGCGFVLVGADIDLARGLGCLLVVIDDFFVRYLVLVFGLGVLGLGCVV